MTFRRIDKVTNENDNDNDSDDNDDDDNINMISNIQQLIFNIKTSHGLSRRWIHGCWFNSSLHCFYMKA